MRDPLRRGAALLVLLSLFSGVLTYSPPSERPAPLPRARSHVNHDKRNADVLTLHEPELESTLDHEDSCEIAFATPPPTKDPWALLQKSEREFSTNKATRAQGSESPSMKLNSRRNRNPFKDNNSFLKKPKMSPKDMLSSIIGITGWNGLDLSNGDFFVDFPLMMADAANTIPPKSGDKKRVLFVMSDTGGGHKASAKAIQGALDELYPGKFECEIKDIWTDEASFPTNKLVPIYQFAAKNPWSWRAIYYGGDFPPTRKMFECTTSLTCGAQFEAYFRAFNPDIVVSVHPLCQHLPLNILKRMGGGVRKVPFVTVITDLGSCSATWFNKEVDKLCVPGDQIEELALRNGIRPYQIRKHGLPVRKGFWQAAEKKKGNRAVRTELGLAAEKPTVLVVGGGDGVGGLKKIAEAVGDRLGEREEEIQLIVVCGKNKVVEKALTERAWASNLAVHVKGFVPNMDEYMIAADCLVTKAGPGTIAEATIVGLPTMLSGFLPGQEAGNVGYVVDGGFGAFDKRPEKIGATVASWLDDKTKLSAMSSLASEYGKIHSKATKEIAVEIASMLD